MSAVKALAIASQQGQRIYTFTQDNLSYLSDLTVEQAIKDEIQAQVQAGKVATMHQHPISYAGWTGAGYTIIDPESGAGAYKISGGSNGGWAALGHLINVFDLFYGGLIAFASSVGTQLPLFKSIINFIKVASFTYSAFNTGLNCSAADAGIIFLTLTTIITLILIQLISSMGNPLAAFGLGIMIDQGISFLTNSVEECN